MFFRVAYVVELNATILYVTPEGMIIRVLDRIADNLSDHHVLDEVAALYDDLMPKASGTIPTQNLFSTA
ncbi:MAG: hypothetical protein ACRD99_01490 [Nitrososphaera sp.]